MAAQLGGDHDGDDGELHDINITPFIDVILVLLIIFMVAAPLSTVDVPVELPVAVAAPQPRPEKPVFVTINKDLSLAVGDTPVARDVLVQHLDMATKLNRETRLYLRGDMTVPYGEMVRLMNLIRIGGYLKIGLVGIEDTPGAAQALPAAGAPSAESKP